MTRDNGLVAGVRRRRNAPSLETIRAGSRFRGELGSATSAERSGRRRGGISIGLLGGSFDPPHEGHVHVTQEALRRVRLHAVWWLVSPGNPLKAAPEGPFQCRVSAARRLIGRQRRISVSDLEARLGTRHTVDTVSRLLRRAPVRRYVWIMGADNLSSLHKWKAWTRFVRQIPIAVVPRPGAQLRAGLSPAARQFSRSRIPQRSAAGLAWTRPPCWCLLGGPSMDASSTRIRECRL